MADRRCHPGSGVDRCGVHRTIVIGEYLAAISGLLFGLFLALALQQWSVYPLTVLSVLSLPLLGLLLGLLLAAWAPLGGRAATAETPTTQPPAGEEPA